MWHRFQSEPSEFLAHYHKRENVEATFAAMKKRLGETLSSKDPVAQENELLAKVLIHNIQVLIHESFERGIPLPGDEEPHTDDSDGPANQPETPIASTADLRAKVQPWFREDN